MEARRAGDRLSRPLRFGFQLSGDLLTDPVASARRAEELGFDIVLTSDHVGPGLSPMVTLAAIAQATRAIRLGTFVLNNDMRNPVQLAWEAVTIDRLCRGRFELGVGAGHTPHEYAATGISLDSPAVRKERLIESVRIVRRLVDGDTVDFEGTHYTLAGARTDRSVQDRLPILVGGNGKHLLGAAGELADIIGLQGLGRTREDGQSHAVRWTTDHLDDQLAQVRTGAGLRSDRLEFNALVQMFEITDDREEALGRVCERVEGLTLDDARSIPYLMIGSVDEIVEHVHQCAERWGITYFVVRELDGFAPILAALR
jgi:probable F420-dependent oxidoreductase